MTILTDSEFDDYLNKIKALKDRARETEDIVEYCILNKEALSISEFLIDTVATEVDCQGELN